jgi:hypothetical protein
MGWENVMSTTRIVIVASLLGLATVANAQSDPDPDGIGLEVQGDSSKEFPLYRVEYPYGQDH